MSPELYNNIDLAALLSGYPEIPLSTCIVIEPYFTVVELTHSLFQCTDTSNSDSKLALCALSSIP